MIAWLDASSGISGDKFLGALLDAGVDLAVVREALDAVLPGEGEIRVERVTRGGIAGARVDVTETRAQPARHWPEIRALLEGSSLAPAVRDRAVAVFADLAAAEAEVHGVPEGSVHFHEVGAVDSIADIVGVVAGLAALGVDELVCSRVAVGSGAVQTSHGLLPVPAPATARLLVGLPAYAGEATGESTTPTGAALVRILADRFGPMPAMTVESVGHGAGSRETEVPNVARLLVGQAEVTADDDLEPVLATPGPGVSTDLVVVLRAVVDHVSAEHLAFALERLLEAGARDAWLTPVVMKKGRPGTEVAVLADIGDGGRLAAELMRHTGTLGVRVEDTVRFVAARGEATADTEFGPVRVKLGPGQTVRAEYDDLARIARERDLTLAEVEDAVRRALAKG
jgi:pyridinium-3,5-bisthiocarboxylic acid mononucleotide nickel chelatase